MRFTLQKRDLFVHFLARTWDTFMDVMLAMNLVWFWKEKGLTNLNLLMVLSLSRYIQTWLSTKSMTTRKIYCCIAFFFRFKAQSWKHRNYWTVYEIINQLATYNSNHCSKNLFITFSLTRETRTVKRYPLYLSVSFVLFWCLEKLPILNSNLKTLTRRLLENN